MLVLVLVALVPALALAATFSWSSRLVPDDAATDESSTGPAGTAAVDATSVAPALSTELLTFRRLPTVVARDANAEALRTDAAATFDLLNDRSCATVSVDGVTVAERNPDLPVIPASNQKLLVAGAALDRLGADFRYRTEVVAANAPVDGVIDGDLVLIGGGDPLLSSDWYPASSLERNPVTSPTSLDTLADRVVEAGVATVTGSIVGDGSRYDDERFAPNWGPGVAGVESGPYDSLLVNDARVLGDDQRSADPNEGAAREFSLLLSARGVDVQGAAMSGAAPTDPVTVASIESAPMSDVVGEMLSTSDNNTAELIVKELGFVEAQAGTREAGLGVIRDVLVDWDVDVSSLVLADGSGLSPDNRLTCDVLIAVLQRTGFSSAVGQGLAIAGQTGTLSDIFDDHAVAGRLRGKTGTLTNPPFNVDPPGVKALAGFLPVVEGGVVEYALVLNGPTIADQSEYRPIWYSMADVLDRYPASVSAAEVGPQ